MGAVVVIQAVHDQEANRILDTLEERIDLSSEKLLGGGRRYTLMSADDWGSAVASLSTHLDRIDPDWRDQLGFIEP